MATVDTYKLKIDVEGQQAVDNLKISLGGLGSIIAGIGFGAFIAGSMKMADSLMDVASASGLSAGYVKGLSEAIKQAGGEFEDITKIVGTFYDKLEQGAAGTEKVQDTLKRVGIGLNELRTLSEQQLFDRAISQLAEMDAGAQRTALGVELFGKSFRTIDPTVLDKILRTKDFNALTTEMTAAADAVDAMEQNYRKLQDAVLKVLGPLIGQVDKLRLTSEQAETIIKALGIAMAVTFGAQVLANIVLITGAIVSLINALKATAAAQSILLALSGPAGWAVLATAGVATATIGLKKLNDELGKTKENMDALDPSKLPWDPRKVQFEPTLMPGNAPTPNAPRGAFPEAKKLSDEEEKSRRAAAEGARQQTQQLIKQNQEALRYQQIVDGTIGMDQERANLLRDQAQINRTINEKNFAEQLLINREKQNERGVNQEIIDQANLRIKANEVQRKQLLEQAKIRNELTSKDRIIIQESELQQLRYQNEEALKYQKILNSTIGMDQTQAGFIQQQAQTRRNIDAQIYADQLLINREKAKETNINYNLIDQATKRIEENTKFRDQLLNDVKLGQQLIQNENIRNQEIAYRRILLDAEATRIETFQNNLIELRENGKLLERQMENTFRQSRLTPFEATLDRIFTNQIELATRLIRILTPFYEDDPIGLMRMSDRITNETLKNITNLQNLATTIEKVQTSFSEGWSKAFNSFIVNSTNAATIAEQSFNAITNNMNSAIDNFVKNGKFKFSDFAQSVIQDLIAIQLKAQAAQILKAGAGILTGAGGIIASALGFANGGQPPVNRPSIVGERGPEIFIPKTAGTIIPNEKAFGTNTENAGQNVYITNNISAIDAKSVAQLFAENRKTLLGTVRLAQKEIGY